MQNNQPYLFEDYTKPCGDPLCRIPAYEVKSESIPIARMFLVGFPDANWRFIKPGQHALQTEQTTLHSELKDLGDNVLRAYVNLRDINYGINASKATSSAEAVSQIIFRRIKNKFIARNICRTLRDTCGYDFMALDLNEEMLLEENGQKRIMTSDESFRYRDTILMVEAASMTGHSYEQCRHALQRVLG
jgi:hypothetical protein